LRNQGYKWAS